MKLLRYRKPSIKTLTGLTKAKRRIKKATGISTMQGYTQPSRIKQRMKQSIGLYSKPMRMGRGLAMGKLIGFLGDLFGKK